MNKNIIIFGAIFLLFVGLVSADSVSRDLPSSVSPNSNVQITLTATGTSGDYFAIVKDNIPTGWTYVSGGSLEGNQVKIFLTSLTGSSSSYTLKSPSSGTHSFSGTYQYTEDNSPLTTSGDTSVSISVSCTPDWQTGSWSTCSSSCTQTRTVTDSNSCGVTTGKPTTTQSCTGGNCNSCTPDCVGKECGPNGCGGTCGTCSGGEMCSSGKCINSGEGVVTRDLPTSANPSSNVEITLTADGYSGDYFAIVKDNIPAGWTYVSGGSLEGNQVKIFLTSLTGNSMTYTLKSPSSTGTKSFSGTYQFTDDSLKTTGGDTSISITGGQTCSCGDWINAGCVGSQMKQTRTCNPSGCDDEEKFVSSSSCGGNGGTESCEERLDCEFYQECNDDESDCKTAGWVVAVGFVFGALIAFSIINK